MMLAKNKLDLNSPDHPLAALAHLTLNAKICGDELSFWFQSFSFTPGEYEDETKYEWHDDAAFSGEEVTKRCDDLKTFFANAEKKEQDVVVASEVKVTQPGKQGSRIMHMPQIDFVCNPTYNEIGRRDDIKAPLDPFHMEFYNSGRSMHAYGICLLTPEEWIKFLGRVLLLNKPGIDVSDHLWVGHSLVRGYTALRLTANNGKYLQVPSTWPNPFLPKEQ
jgi:hypothetical protein